MRAKVSKLILEQPRVDIYFREVNIKILSSTGAPIKFSPRPYRSCRIARTFLCIRVRTCIHCVYYYSLVRTARFSSVNFSLAQRVPRAMTNVYHRVSGQCDTLWLAVPFASRARETTAVI